MISNLISFFISTRLQREPIYEALAYQDGIHLPNAATRNQRGGRQVSEIMRSPDETLSAEVTVFEALQSASARCQECWPVCDKRGVIGVINKQELQTLAAGSRRTSVLASVLETRAFPHLHADQPVHLALERMGATGFDLLPVVSRADVHALEGVVLLRDILNSYGVGANT
jgi:CIC family chloride channel protein